MKRIAFMFAVCCLALVACNKEEPAPDPSGSVPENLFVQMGEQGGTKSYFTTSDKKTYTHYWNEGDDISVFWENATNLMYRANNINKDKGYSDFKITSYSYNSASTVGANNRYAMYPYSKDNKIVESSGTPTFYYSVPNEQTYRQVSSAGTFGTASYNNGADSKDMGCAVYIAKNTAASASADKSNYFDFYNVGCWMRLDLKAKTSDDVFTVGKLVLSANPDVALSGTATCAGDPNTLRSDTFEQSAARFTFPTGSSSNKSITVNCTSGVSLATGTAQSFYFYFFPIGLKGGFTDGLATPVTKGFNIKVYDNESTPNLRAVLTNTTITNESNTLFIRNQVVNLKEVEIESNKIQYTVTVASWGDGGSTDINLE